MIGPLSTRALGAALCLALAFSAAAAEGAPQAASPLALHPQNPHYFLFRAQPTVLITSGEHYGAVLNLDFDYGPYLDELQAHGLNLTRTFAGTYREIPGSFKIEGNTLAPRPNRYICPWARTDTPGYFDGGGKFDLKRFDEAYFARLKEFVAQAGRRGVVVELVLFCPNYNDKLWQASPMSAGNNVNGIGAFGKDEPYTLKHPELLEIQDAVTRRIVRELNAFDNVYYEICNEPYFGGVTLEWQKHIADTIVAAEADLPHKHLIAQNIANGSTRIENPNPAVSIFNFHYSSPPNSVAMNYPLNKPIAFDETGFKGSADRTYRAQAWEFLIAGGSVFSNLDYSFTPEHEAGTAVPNAPGGGGRAYRQQLRILKEFLYGFDFLKMAPDNSALAGALPAGIAGRVLSEKGKAYALYLRADAAKPGAAVAEVSLDLPAGSYRAEWVSTLNGKVERAETFTHAGGARKLSVPPFAEDIALRVMRGA